MKLIFIYGIPASGKLTIAKELAKITRYKLFDNHLILDFLHKLILGKKSPFDKKVTKDFFKLYTLSRVKIIETACKIKDINGLIITEAYTGKKQYFQRMIRAAEKNKCTVYMIRLECHPKELERRVCGKSRKNAGKLQDKKGLCKWIEGHKKRSLNYPHKNTLVLDNTNLSARESANRILKFIRK